MSTYVILMTLTDQGIRNIKEAPERIETATKALEVAGGKLMGFYVVFGQYHYVAIVEAPNDEVAMTQLAGLGAAGNVRTTSLKAFTKEEFAEMLKKLP